MPKRSKKATNRQRNAGRVQGPVSHWPPAERLSYHLAECAMHLQMVEQILEEEGYSGSVLEHRKQAGLRLRVMWKELRKLYPTMLRQPE